MKRRLSILMLMSLILIGISFESWAINGAQDMGTSPESRSMGGTGIANPQSASSSLYLNPGTMIYFGKGAYSLGGSLAVPSASAKVGNNPWVNSQDYPFAIPNAAVVVPVTDSIYLGLGFIGVGGLGVDYRGLGAGTSDINTKIQIFDLIPALAVRLGGIIGIGLALPVTYQSVALDATSSPFADAAAGPSHGYGIGLKLGVTADISLLKFGFYYRHSPLLTPKHNRAMGERNTTTFAFVGYRDLKLASPMEVGLGVSLTMVKDLIVSLDGKWINWSKADGWKDFGLADQYVILFGVQYTVMKAIKLRAGYNYSKQPITPHNGTESTTVQGVDFLLNFEKLRDVGMAALSEHHFCIGIGYELSKALSINLGGVIMLNNTSTTTGSNTPFTGTTTYQAKLGGWALDMGISGSFN